MSERRVVSEVIVDLIQIGSLYEYLVSHWHRKHIRVSIWENGIRQPIRHMTTYQEVEKLYRYLLNNWGGRKIKVTVWERNPPSKALTKEG